MSEQVSRRGFLKASGTSLLTVGALAGGSSTAPVKKKVVKKTVKKVTPVKKGLSPQAKAYRKFLHFITKGNYDVVKGHHGVYTKEYPKSETGKISPITGSSVDRTLSLKEATGKTGRQIASTDQTRNLAREAFGSSISGKNKPVIKAGNTIYEVKSKFPSAELALKGKYSEKLRLRDFQAFNTGNPFNQVIGAEEWSKEVKTQTKVARTALAKEIKAERSRKKSISKRGIYEKIKSKVKKVTQKIRGGGGKMPIPGMETAKDPTGMSLIRKYTL